MNDALRRFLGFLNRPLRKETLFEGVCPACGKTVHFREAPRPWLDRCHSCDAWMVLPGREGATVKTPSKTEWLQLSIDASIDRATWRIETRLDRIRHDTGCLLTIMFIWLIIFVLAVLGIIGGM